MSDAAYLEETELFARSARAIDALTTEIARLRDEHAKLLGFVRAVIACRHDDGIDGFDLQDMAEANGILIPEDRSEPCGEGCACAEVLSPDEFPTTCYRLAEFVRNANGS